MTTLLKFGAGLRRRLLILMMVLAGLSGVELARAEFGDIVINNYSDPAGMRPAVFPHWFHRIRFACKVCHADLGFKFKAGGNEINMVKIIDGQYCGACHNGNIAWSVDNCDLCHSARPGTATQVHESTIGSLVVPVGVLAPASSKPLPASSTPAPASSALAPQKK